MSSTGSQRRDQRRRLRRVLESRPRDCRRRPPRPTPACDDGGLRSRGASGAAAGPATLLPTGIGGLCAGDRRRSSCRARGRVAAGGCAGRLFGRPLVRRPAAGSRARSRRPGLLRSARRRPRCRSGWRRCSSSLRPRWRCRAAHAAASPRRLRGPLPGLGLAGRRCFVATACAGSGSARPARAGGLSDATGIASGRDGVGWWVRPGDAARVVSLWAVLPLHERTGDAIWLARRSRPGAYRPRRRGWPRETRGFGGRRRAAWAVGGRARADRDARGGAVGDPRGARRGGRRREAARSRRAQDAGGRRPGAGACRTLGCRRSASSRPTRRRTTTASRSTPTARTR